MINSIKGKNPNSNPNDLHTYHREHFLGTVFAALWYQFLRLILKDH